MSAARHARQQRRHRRALHSILATVLALVVFGGTGGALAYHDFQGNIERHDLGDFLNDNDRPGGSPKPIDPNPGEPINALVLGSDTREGDVNEEYGSTPEDGMRSDTTMLLHVSADRERVEIVSIPRDTLVDRPSCVLPDGTESAPATDVMFNSAFATGGDEDNVGTAAACTIRTVEELTDIYIDDFVVVDFAGFIDVIDALGGVPMCVEEDIDDPRAKADIDAGQQVLDGREALALARARYTLGDGSDISRIGRQQELVAAIAREALSKNLLSDMPALYRFLDAATSTLTTGDQLGSVRTLAGLAYSLRGIDIESIALETMPYNWAGDRVRPSAEADELWQAISEDEAIDASLTGTGEPPSEEASDSDDDQDNAVTEDPAEEESSAPEPGETPSVCE